MTDGAAVWTVVVGAGRGTRFGGLKQYEEIGGSRIIDRSVSAARAAGSQVILVVPVEDAEREGGVAGGESRAESVRAGLAAVPDDAEIICVHDAARPFASVALFERVIAAVRAGADGAVPGMPVSDTIKVVRSVDGELEVASTLERSTLSAVQTPQAFRADVLRAAHAGGADGTDDASLVEASGGRVVVVEGEAVNRKITTTDDLEWARGMVGR